MRLIITSYYLCYLISGGFRHFEKELELIGIIEGAALNELLVLFLRFGEFSLMLMAAIICVRPTRKWPHMTFFVLLFLMDFYFQNFVRFQNAVLLIHLIPIFFFAYLKCRDARSIQALNYIAILVISIGFATSGVAKALSGWLSLDNSVNYEYVRQFALGYGIKGILADWFLTFGTAFWEVLDYAVVLFEVSFLANFYNSRIFPKLSVLAVSFHLGVILLLNITLFYPFILFYTFVNELTTGESISRSDMSKGWTREAVVVLIVIIFYALWGVQFVNHWVPAGHINNVGTLLTILCSVLFFSKWIVLLRAPTEVCTLSIDDL